MSDVSGTLLWLYLLLFIFFINHNISGQYNGQITAILSMKETMDKTKKKEAKDK